jgi:hypothetical protein
VLAYAGGSIADRRREACSIEARKERQRGRWRWRLPEA